MKKVSRSAVAKYASQFSISCKRSAQNFRFLLNTVSYPRDFHLQLQAERNEEESTAVYAKKLDIWYTKVPLTKSIGTFKAVTSGG